MATVNGNLLVKGQLLDLKPEVLATDPLVGTLGSAPRLWVNSTDKVLKFFNGTAIEGLSVTEGQTEQEVTDAIAAALATYSTAAEVTSEISTAVDGLVTDGELATAVSGLVNTTALNNAIDNALSGLDFQADVVGLESDFVDQAGRYVYVDGVTFSSGVAAAAGDIVDVDAAGVILSVAYDVSAQGAGALAWNTAGIEWLRYDGSTWAVFGGLTGFTAGDGIEKTGDVVSVKLDGATLTVGVNGLKVGDLSATYVTPAAQTTALAPYAQTSAVTSAISAAVADLASDADVAAAVDGLAVATAVTSEIATAVSGLAVATAVTSEIATAVSGLAVATAVTTEIADAVSDLASNTSVTNAIDNALSGLDFQSDVIGLETDFVDAPGRYIFTSGDTFATGVAASFGDIVVVDAAGEILSVAYDVSVEGSGALAWNTASLTWLRYNGSAWSDFGGLSGVSAGDGISKVDDVVSVKLDGATLTVGANGLKVGDLSAIYVTPAALDAADFATATDVSTAVSGLATAASVTDLAADVTGSFYTETTNAAATSHVITHGLGFRFPVVQVVDKATNKLLIADDVTFDSTTQLTITLNVAADVIVSVTWIKA